MQKSKDKIRMEMKDSIEMYEAKIRLWKNVKRLSKKDGSDFQNFGKNFENAEYVRGRICSDDVELRVADYGIRVAGNWVDDSLDIRQIVKYSKITPEENQIIKESYMEPYFYLTVDQTMQMIQIKIETYEKMISEYKEQLEKLDSLYDYVKDSLTEIMQKLRKETGGSSTLFYELRNYIKEVGY